MKLRGLLVATVVLAGLCGALYWSNKHKPSETTEASADVPPKILSVKEADITKFDLKKKDGNEVALQKNSSGKWEMTAPQPYPVDQSAVSSMLGTFSSLNSNRVVEDKATSLDQYGLSAPNLAIALTEKDNKTQKLLLGDETAAGNSMYAKLDGDPRVFTIPSYTKTSIDKSANDLRDKRLLTVDSDKVSKVELIAKKKDIEFGRSKDEWQIVKPQPLRADSSEVDELVRKLTNARMDLSGADADAKKAAAGFAGGTPVATAKLTDQSGTQELQVRKNKNDYYAKSSAVEGVYKVDNDLGQGLDKAVDDFRNKKLFDFGFNDPNKIEVHEGSKAYFLTKGGEDWWLGDGKKADADSAQTLVDDIRDLSATKFVDSGFTTPMLDLTATSNDGKRVEKVLIAKTGDTYIAKRENEPALYSLDSKSVEDLQKAAGDLKPAATPAKK
jgi:Domain of unknown function (DUF4340)